MKLRLPLDAQVIEAKRVTLEIMTPVDDYEQYQRQRPLKIDARVVRKERSGGNAVYGLEFEGLNAEQTRRIEECFSYFLKAPRYAA